MPLAARAPYLLIVKLTRSSVSEAIGDNASAPHGLIYPSNLPSSLGYVHLS